jgi:hypothetical protein
MSRKILFAGILFILVAPLSSFIVSQKVKAASITTVAVALGNEATSATNTVTVTFTPNTAITNNTIIEVNYDTGFTGGASIADGDVSVTGTNITSSAEAGFAAGYFRSTLTTSGSVTTTVTIAIDASPGLTTPSTSGNYNWSVAINIGGAGSTFDYGAGLAYVADDNDVTITAIVPPTIDMELYQQGSDSELVDPNTCAIGPLSLSTVKSCVYDLGFATNNASGLTVKIIADAQLNSGGNDVNAVADGTVTAGSEEYGVRITDIGTGCSASGASTFASADTAVPTTTTNFITSTSTCNGTTAGQTAKRAEVTHRASMDTATVVGSYDQLVTYTAFTN